MNGICYIEFKSHLYPIYITDTALLMANAGFSLKYLFNPQRKKTQMPFSKSTHEVFPTEYLEC